MRGKVSGNPHAWRRGIEGCVYCGACFRACPIVFSDGSTLAERIVLGTWKEEDLWYCLNCRACSEACPFGLSPRDFVMLERRKHWEKAPQLIKSMVNSILEKGLSAEPHPVQLRIRERTGLPLTRPTGLREFLKGSVKVEPTLIGDGKKVMLYPGCMVFYRFPEYEASALKLLLELGFSIVYPSTITCCGSTLLESYDTKTWVLAGAVIHAIAQELGAQCIVTLCGTCTSTLHIVRELLNENTKIREWVNEVLEKNNLKYHGGATVKHMLEVILEKRSKLPEPRELCASREDVDVVLQLPCNITRANGVIRGSEVLGVLREWLSTLSPSPSISESGTCCYGSILAVDSSYAERMLSEKLSRATVSQDRKTLYVMACPTCMMSYLQVVDPNQLLFVTQLLTGMWETPKSRGSEYYLW